jgi:hypothetical protein
MRLPFFLSVSVLALANVASAQWSDNFDSYTLGSILGQGGWESWSVNADGFVVGAPVVTPRSGTRALRVGQNPGLLETDCVHQYYVPSTSTGLQYTSGKWVYEIYQYMPSTMTGTTYFILMSEYASPAGPYKWAIQVPMTTTSVDPDNPNLPTGNPASVATVTDQWVPIRVHIDLDNDTAEFFYNNIQVGPTYPWTGGPFGGTGGPLALAAVDLYANNATDVFYDDADLRPLVVEQHNRGCNASSGPIGMSVLVPPSVAAGVYVYQYTNLPTPVAFGVYGVSKETFGVFSLPVDLGLLGGIPGCQGHVSFDYASSLISSTPAPGPYVAADSLPLSLPTLIGFRLYHQALAFDPLAGSLQLTTSPAFSVVIQP